MSGEPCSDGTLTRGEPKVIAEPFSVGVGGLDVDVVFYAFNVFF
jgi:hypothetical protein